MGLWLALPLMHASGTSCLLLLTRMLFFNADYNAPSYFSEVFFVWLKISWDLVLEAANVARIHKACLVEGKCKWKWKFGSGFSLVRSGLRGSGVYTSSWVGPAVVTKGSKYTFTSHIDPIFLLSYTYLLVLLNCLHHLQLPKLNKWKVIFHASSYNLITTWRELVSI